MIEFIKANRKEINKEIMKDFYCLRKKIFKDKLNWAVKCTGDMEFDEYDNDNASYVLGIIDNKVVCGSRLINMKNNNMLEGIFYKFFENKEIIKNNTIELTRIFVDKERECKLCTKEYPIILDLLFNIREFSKNLGFDGIYAVVTDQMFKTMKKSGWEIELRQYGKSEKNEDVYLIIMPTSEESIFKLKEKIKIKTIKY